MSQTLTTEHTDESFTATALLTEMNNYTTRLLQAINEIVSLDATSPYLSNLDKVRDILRCFAAHGIAVVPAEPTERMVDCVRYAMENYMDGNPEAWAQDVIDAGILALLDTEENCDD